mgnify:CR=1 FL=1
MLGHESTKNREVFGGQEPLLTGQELIAIFGVIVVGLALVFLLNVSWSIAAPLAVVGAGIGMLVLGIRHGSFAFTVVGGLVGTAGLMFVFNAPTGMAVPLFVAAIGIVILMLIATERI